MNCWNGREGIPFVFRNLEIYRVLNKSSDNAIKLLDYMGLLLNAYRSYYQPDYTHIGKKFTIDEIRRSSPLIIKILKSDSNTEGLFTIFDFDGFKPIINFINSMLDICYEEIKRLIEASNAGEKKKYRSAIRKLFAR